MKPYISTIISYCTNDDRYLKKCVEEASHFSDQIIIPVCDHFFNGDPENPLLLEKAYQENPEAEFIEFAYYPDKLYTKIVHCDPKDKYWNLYWNGIARYIGFLHIRPETDYVLFIDTDEIFDGKRFSEWLIKKMPIEEAALRFAAYLYYREPSIQSTQYQCLPLLVRKDAIKPLMAINADERAGIYHAIHQKKDFMVLGLDQLPLVHHYSWVRTKEECLQKTKTWSHWWEKDWKDLIDEEYSREFNGTDFLYQHTYRKVIPYFDPFVPRFQSKCSKIKNVTKVQYNDILKKDIEFEFGVELHA